MRELKDHVITLIKKRTSAASKRSVRVMIEDAIKRMRERPKRPPELEPEVSDDPEILEQAYEIARDAQLFKKRIDTIGQLGVEGEPGPLGLNSTLIDNAKLPMGPGGSEVIAATQDRKGAGNPDRSF